MHGKMVRILPASTRPSRHVVYRGVYPFISPSVGEPNATNMDQTRRISYQLNRITQGCQSEQRANCRRRTNPSKAPIVEKYVWLVSEASTAPCPTCHAFHSAKLKSAVL
ncbi:hypothetical protein VFPPC_17816 [Pochonia chlamydosporia 170]|uniref:Uncharacterized protein n=1 Tax=Pochonia chlamydosporia 170 TaxID=1380566 RepID=A0A219AQG9_METCM|nr:hypothetical protein VFPPC_17816 [Pochonia chlamydosporia 170]OWT42991.1 hypothetical protein VFPPC_17816 [Pochonia chlamydosporia 170]